MISVTARCPSMQAHTRSCPGGMPRRLGISRSSSSVPVLASAAAGSSSKAVDEALVARLKAATKQPGSVPTREIMRSVITVEQAKAKAEGWEQNISAPSARWRLTYTLPAKDVVAASKKGGQPKGNGQYFPIAACQKFDAVEQSFENGVFLGPVFHLTFKGPYMMTGRNLYFDVCTMYLGLGPWRVPITLKKDCRPLRERDPKEVKKLPFFVYSWADGDIIVARGRSGGVALWGRADADWQARAGVMQVYK